VSHIILAIDPGSRNSGIVVRRGEELLAWRLAVRGDTARLPGGPYLHEVLTACRQALVQADVNPAHRDSYVVGVEGVAYWPERGSTRRDQNGLYGTAMVLGAILARWPRAMMVDSGRGVANYHPQAYPEPIRPAVNGKGLDRLKDVRAAWDHSHAAETLWLQQEREHQP
jgi:hypothetical protein